MKQIVRYRFMTIPSKLTGEIRITVEDRAVEYLSVYDGGQSTSVSLSPIINLAITRPPETDENGNRVRPPWNPNDSICLTKFSLPIFLKELKGIERDMQTPELYTYHGTRLELNDEAANKVRRVFMISNTTLELTAVVIEQLDETKVEGIKMKFNNEQSTVLLTLNELTSLVYNLNALNPDQLAFQLYLTYVNRASTRGGNKMRDNNPKVPVDIAPKKDAPLPTTFKEFEE